MDDFFSTSGGPHGRPNTTVSVGLAVSGGGLRSFTIGAGVIAALDARDQPNTPRGKLAGLLQGVSHFSALSSSGWLLGSLYLNDFKTVGQLRQSDRVWRFENNMLLPNNGNNFYFNDGLYYTTVAAQLSTKMAAGYGVTLTDLWGRFLSRMLVEKDSANSGGAAPGTSWSDIQNYGYFQSHNAPYPILSAVNRLPGSIGTYPNSTVVEITPHEIGSFDASLHSFSKLQYLGTSVDNNQVRNNNNGNSRRCVNGYDNAGLIMGTTSNIFNKALEVAMQSNSVVLSTMASFASVFFDPTNLDVAAFSPNPFYNYRNPTYQPTTDALSKTNVLGLTDGALGDENVPLWPLLYKPRNIDIIFTVDASTDTSRGWPAGKSLAATYARASGAVKGAEEGSTGHYAQKHFMPKVPDANTFVNLGLSTRPTFLGCYGMDYMSDDEMQRRDTTRVPPLLVYLGNAPMSYMSNKNTFQMTYTRDEQDKMYQNGFDIADQGPAVGGDADWPKCVACATIQRERERQGKFEPTDECGACFDKYCWNGSTDSRDYNNAKLHNDPKVGHR